MPVAELQRSDFLLSMSANISDEEEGAAFDSYNLVEVDKTVTRKVLSYHHENVSKAAHELGLTRTSLYRRMSDAHTAAFFSDHAGNTTICPYHPSFTTPTGKKQISLEISAEPETLEITLGPELIEQVLINLMTNAFRCFRIIPLRPFNESVVRTLRAGLLFRSRITDLASSRMYREKYPFHFSQRSKLHRGSA